MLYRASGCEHLKNGVDWNANVSSVLPGKQASRLFYSPKNGVDWNADVSSVLPGKQASCLFYSLKNGVDWNADVSSVLSGKQTFPSVLFPEKRS